MNIDKLYPKYSWGPIGNLRCNLKIRNCTGRDPGFSEFLLIWIRNFRPWPLFGDFLTHALTVVNLLNSAEIYKNIRRIKKPTTGARSAPVGRGRRPRLWFLYFSLCFCIFQLNWINWLNLLNQLNPNYPLRNYPLLSLLDLSSPTLLVNVDLQMKAWEHWASTIQEGVKGGNCKEGNWDLVDLVDLVNLFNSAEIYKNIKRNKEPKAQPSAAPHRGAERHCGWFLWFSFRFFVYFSWIE